MQSEGLNTKLPEIFWKEKPDTVTISEEGMRQLQEMRENRKPFEEWIGWIRLNTARLAWAPVTYVAALAEVGEDLNAYKIGEWTKASTMGTAYGVLRAEIESRYDDPDYQPAIVVEEDGVTGASDDAGGRACNP